MPPPGRRSSRPSGAPLGASRCRPRARGPRRRSPRRTRLPRNADLARGVVAEVRRESRSARCQKPLTKPALRPLGPEPQVSASSTAMREAGIPLGELPGRPQTRVPATDDRDVGPHRPPSAAAAGPPDRTRRANIRRDRVDEPWPVKSEPSSAHGTAVPESSEIQLSIEDDPTPMVLSIRSDLVRRLADPAYAELTAAIRGRATIRAPATPEAVTATIADRRVTLAHGVGRRGPGRRDPRARRAAGPAVGRREGQLPGAVRLADPRCSRRPTTGPAAAERFWAALEPLPGAPQALLVAELDSGEQRRFGGEGRAYEMHGRAEDLTALLEGRARADRRGVRAPDLHPRLVPGDLRARRAGFEVRTGGRADG